MLRLTNVSHALGNARQAGITAQSPSLRPPGGVPPHPAAGVGGHLIPFKPRPA